MFIKQGMHGTTSLVNKSAFIEKKGTNYYFSINRYSTTKEITVSLNEVISADVISEEKATGGGVQGAAAGGVLGFLVLGPVGTVLGAGMGSQKKGRDATTISITFSSGKIWIAENPTPTELAYLQSAIAKNQKTANQSLEKNTAKKSTVKKNQKKIIKRTAPPPKESFRNFSIKGRAEMERKDQPELPIFGLVTSLDSTNPLHKAILKYLDEYHLYIWTHFDAMLSIDNEVRGVAPKILQNLFTLANQQNDLKDLIDKAKKLQSKFEDQLSELMPLKEKAESNILGANIFSKRKFRDELRTIELRIYKEKDAISSQKRKITTAKNKLNQLGQLVEIPNLVNQIKDLNQVICPENKLNLKLKKPQKINDQFYLDVYRSVFRELEDIRVKKEQDIIDKEFEAAKIKKTQKEKTKNTDNDSKKTKPTKERLKELKDLFDNGILDNAEYENQRKKIIESI